jgi:hypothetical protein
MLYDSKDDQESADNGENQTHEIVPFCTQGTFVTRAIAHVQRTMVVNRILPPQASLDRRTLADLYSAGAPCARRIQQY